jgi:hypothetical protein
MVTTRCITLLSVVAVACAEEGTEQVPSVSRGDQYTPYDASSIQAVTAAFSRAG